MIVDLPSSTFNSLRSFVQLDGISREWNTRGSESIMISERRLIKVPRINGLSSPRENEKHRDTTNPLGHLPEECMFLRVRVSVHLPTPCHRVSLPTFPRIYTSTSLAVAFNNSTVFHFRLLWLLWICESVNQITLLLTSFAGPLLSRWSSIAAFIQSYFICIF